MREVSAGAVESFLIVVPGRAQPAGSKNASPHGGVYDANKKAGPWKERVAIVAASVWNGRPLLDGPLMFSADIVLARPAGHFNGKGELNKKGRATPYPIGKPDVLKMARALEDALKGVVYVDDSRIVTEGLTKRWGPRDEVTIKVCPMTDRA